MKSALAGATTTSSPIARKLDMRHVVGDPAIPQVGEHRLARQPLHRHRGDEPAAGLGHDHLHVHTRPDQQAAQLGGLVGRDAAGDARAGRACPRAPWSTCCGGSCVKVRGILRELDVRSGRAGEEQRGGPIGEDPGRKLGDRKLATGRATTGEVARARRREPLGRRVVGHFSARRGEGQERSRPRPRPDRTFRLAQRAVRGGPGAVAEDVRRRARRRAPSSRPRSSSRVAPCKRKSRPGRPSYRLAPFASTCAATSG